MGLTLAEKVLARTSGQQAVKARDSAQKARCIFCNLCMLYLKGWIL